MKRLFLFIFAFLLILQSGFSWSWPWSNPLNGKVFIAGPYNSIGSTVFEVIVFESDNSFMEGQLTPGYSKVDFTFLGGKGTYEVHGEDLEEDTRFGHYSYKFSIEGRVLRLKTVDGEDHGKYIELPKPLFYEDPNGPYNSLPASPRKFTFYSADISDEGKTKFIIDYIAKLSGEKPDSVLSSPKPQPETNNQTSTQSATSASSSTSIKGRENWPSQPTPTSRPVSSPSPATTPSPTPNPSYPVSSSNPIIYSGDFIIDTTGQNGNLELRIEHIINKGNGLLTIGGKLNCDNFSSSSVSGSYNPATSEINLSPGLQSQTTWSGNIEGEVIKGSYVHRIYNGNEVGNWNAKHSGGLSLQEAGKVYAGANSVASSIITSAPASPVSAPTTDRNTSFDGVYQGSTHNDATLATHQIKMTLATKPDQSAAAPSSLVDVTIVDLGNNNTFFADGTITLSEPTRLSFNMKNIQHWDGSFNGGHLSGIWRSHNPDTGEKFTGTFELQKSQ